MQQGFPRYPGSLGEVKAENAHMRQQLKEKGAQFSEGNFPVDDDEAENRFLKNVMEYERQIEKGIKVMIFDKIGRPVHFKPAAQVPDENIETALKEVIDYLHTYSIDLDVCSPSVTSRELYRFAIEELFYHKMDDINVPGMITCFIYDEFHPDPVYDNTIAATDYCMKYILDKEPLQLMHHFRPDNLRLNGYQSLTAETVKEKVNAYKSRYQDIRIERLTSRDCTIDKDRCLVSGVYAVMAIRSNGRIKLSGHWRVHFERNREFDNWIIAGIEIEGISF